MLGLLSAVFSARSVRAATRPAQNGDCHQFLPLELVGCTRFAYGRYSASRAPYFHPPGMRCILYNATYTVIAWSAAASSPRQIRRDVQSPAGRLQKALDGPSPKGRNTPAHRYKLPVEM